MSGENNRATAFSFFNEVGIIDQLASNLFERRMPHGLRLAQFSVLNRFVRLGGHATPVELARAFQVTKGAMTNTLQRLHGAGFVDITPDASDGRRKLVSITDAGRGAHGDAVAAVTPDLNAAVATLDPESFAAALPFLEQVRRYLDEHR